MRITKLKNPKWNLVAGIIMMILGIFVWLNPFGTMLALAFYLGLGFVLAGAFYIMASMSIKSGWYLLVGILDLLVGFIFMANLGVTAATLPIIVALWCLTVGVVQAVGALEIRRYGLPWGWSMTMGIIGVMFGLLILVYPMVGMITISTVIGLYAIMFGLLQFAEYYASKDKYALLTDEK